jgi:tetratricopeptide (TPR) repeat protein
MEEKQPENPPEAASLPLYRVWLCGPFALERRAADTYVELDPKDFRDASTRALVKALLCASRRQKTKSALLAQLWPRAESDQKAAHLLSNAALSAQKVLGELLHKEEKTQIFSLPGQSVLWVDVDAALALMKQVQRLQVQATETGELSPDIQPLLEEACTYFARGAFLANEASREWAKQRRADVEVGDHQCRLSLADLRLHQGQWEAGEALLRDLLEEDPTNEEVLSRMMELWSRQGRTQEALLLYRRIKQDVEQEEGCLSDALQDLAARLQKERQFVIQWGNGSQPVPGERVPTIALLPPGRMLPPVVPFEDPLDWFIQRATDVKALGAYWQGPALIDEQQSLIHAEIETWDAMNDDSPEFSSGRRAALLNLAAVSSSLLLNMQRGPLTTLVIEEFLAACATSTVACWHLLNGEGLTKVEKTVPRYLPLLRLLTEQPPYRQRASYLAAQNYLLLGLVAHHRLRFSERVTHCQRAVTFAQEANDPLLLLKALTQLSSALYSENRFAEILHVLQRAKQVLAETISPVPSILQSRVVADLARAYASQGQKQKALAAIGEARTLFPSNQEEMPVFLAADEGLALLILYEGWVSIDLGRSEQKREHYQRAAQALAEIEHFPQALFVPERIRVEITNRRAQAAIALGNLDAFCHYTQQSAASFSTLKSAKRRQEALENWQAARQRWPKEPGVLELADLFLTE